MRKLFKAKKLFTGGNYMRKYGNSIDDDLILCFLGVLNFAVLSQEKSPNSIKQAIGQINVT